jgi:hypothetical protein
MKTAPKHHFGSYEYIVGCIGLLKEEDGDFKLASEQAYVMQHVLPSEGLLDGIEIRVDLRDLVSEYSVTDTIYAYLPVKYDTELYGAFFLTATPGTLI